MKTSAMLTSTKNRQTKSRGMSSLMTATLLTVAATMLVQSTNAAVISSNKAGVQFAEPRHLDLFENADGAGNMMMMEKRYDTSLSSEHNSWISKALVLAGTYSPTVSTIAGKATSTSATSTSKATSKTTTSTSAAKTTSTTAKATSSTTKAAASSCNVKTTAKSSSTSAANDKVTVTSRSSTSTTKVTSSTKTSTSAKGTVFPTAQSVTKAKTTTTTAKPQTTETQTWSWAVGAYGCGTSSPSGRAILCYATGTGVANQKRAPQATSAPYVEARQSEYIKRADARQSNTASASNDDASSPDLGWLDTVVGAVPNRKSDLVASIVWIVVTLMLIPLFGLKLVRGSSLAVPSLVCILAWACASVAAFGIRAWMATSTPTTKFMIAENILLQTLPCLLLEPLLSLLAMYSANGEIKSGVPSVCMLLRLLNVVALALFAATAAYTSIFMTQWDNALMSSMDSGARDAFPAYMPANIVRLGPIIGSFMMLAVIAGGLLLIPVARGATGSMRPGGFLAVLFTLLGISVAYRILQTLHAQSALSNAAEAEASKSTDVVSTTLLQLASTSIVQIADIAPAGMFNSDIKGIAWSKLRSTMASRGVPQSAVIFNLVYVLPMWLQVFLLFFVHAPGGSNSTDDSIKSKEAALEADA